MAWRFYSNLGAEKTQAQSFNYVTSLPSSPSDGQLAVLVDSLTNPTYQWLFRYNAGSANTDKWEFVGGTPVQKDGQNGTVTNTAFTDPTVVVSFTVPRAGQYDIDFAAFQEDGGGAITSNTALKRGASATVDSDGINPAVGNSCKTGRRIIRVTAAASDVFKLQAKVSSGTVTLRSQTFTVTPVRVS